MDISKLSHGAKLVLAGTVLFLLFSFFDWFSVEGIGGLSMWNGVGTLAGLLAIALIVWEGLRLVNISVALPVTPAMVSAFIAILMLLFTFIRFIDKPGSSIVSDAFDRTIWAWLGIILAILVVVGAVMNMQAAGESFASVKDTIASGAAAASSAAKSASSSEGSAAPAPTQAPTAPPPSTGDVAESASESASTAEDAVDGPDRPAV